MPAPIPPLRIETRIFTFYSFKGGVGRSMALLNTAAQLAREGRRVLAIDLDLEAPGLSYLALEKTQAPKRGGFVDALYDLLTEQEKSPVGNLKNAKPFADYCTKLDLREIAQGEEAGDIWVMPAGNLSKLAEYQRRMGYLQFDRLYSEGVGAPLLAHFKNRLITSKEFDYVLVDSRTGLSAESGIAVRDLADHLLVVMGLNHQNVEGTCTFLRALHVEKQRPQTLTVILSPIPLGEDELASQRIVIAREQITKAWPGKTVTPADEIQIPYHPRLALDERPHKERITNRHLSDAYRKVHSVVRRLASDDSPSYFRNAQRLIQEGKVNDALPFLVGLLASEHPRAEKLAIEAYKATKEPSILEQILGMLIERASKSFSAADTAAALACEKRQWETADRAWEAYLMKHPDDANAWGTRAEASEKASKLKVATKYFETAVAKAPDNAWLLNRYACHLWEARGFRAKAREYFRRSLEVAPNHPAGRANYAEYSIAVGDYETASIYLKKAWEAEIAQRGKPIWPGHLFFCTAIYCELKGHAVAARLQLGRLRWGLSQHFAERNSTFEALLKAASTRLKPAKLKFYKTLASVIQTKVEMSVLDRFPQWRSVRRMAPKGELF